MCEDTPVACTLTSADLATQQDRWHSLAGRAILERLDTADGVRISFRPDAGVHEELHALAAIENDCCAWASWTVEKRDGAIVLEVRSTGEGIPTLHGMFGSLQPAVAV
ncbi:MAG: hypothetical protein ACJ768_09130 [Gaiellaceae bacterium]